MTALQVQVAIIEPVGGHRGMNYYDFAQATALVDAGVQTTLYTSDETIPPAWPNFSLSLCFRDIYGQAPKWLRGLRFVRGVIHCLRDARRCGANIVHLHIFQTGIRELLCAWGARLCGLKLIMTVHDVQSFAGEGGRGTANSLFDIADALIVHNQVSQKELTALSPVGEKTHIIPHGNYSSFVGNGIAKQQAREQLGIEQDATMLLFFGQIKQVKGLDILLDAMAKVADELPSVHLVVAGKVWKDDFSRYQAQIDRGQLADRVTCRIEYIPDDEAPVYYHATDLVVLPYREIYQSGVLLMAMSFGVAVLASDLPGMTEVIENDRTGFTFKVGDADDLAVQLRRLLKAPERLESVGKAGRQTVETDYDWQRIGLATAAVYRQVMTEGS